MRLIYHHLIMSTKIDLEFTVVEELKKVQQGEGGLSWEAGFTTLGGCFGLSSEEQR